MDKINLKNLTIEELEELVASIGAPKFSAKQIFEWIYRGVSSFDDMTNISKDLRTKLNEASYIGKTVILKKYKSSVDETIKYLLELEDKNVIEAVLMKYHHGFSICISSQVGCRMGCRFCASTINGLSRNLTHGEMIDQILCVSSDIGQRISNVVIMGIGEPLDNYDNLVKFLKTINEKAGLNIGHRHITVSTSGLVPNILKLAEEEFQINLAISLHAPNDVIRKTIMPIANKYSIKEIISACKTYINATNRRITFEYSLISGVNDNAANAKELSKLLQNLLCHVNLIAVNEIKESNFKKSDMTNILNFQKILIQNGIATTIRRELGSDISASCGQLRNNNMV